MSAPVTRFSKLSLEGMPPETRSRTRAQAQSLAAESEQLYQGESSSESESDSDSTNFDDDSSEADSNEPSVVRSPTRLTYLLDHLPDATQSSIRDVFKEPPKIALQKCRRIDDTYAFQMTELVTRSIRIRAPEDDGASRLSCSCQNDQEPCQHLMWLLDQIVKQTLYDHDLSKPLKMTQGGFAEEIGDPFHQISNYHLGVLADGLHCHLVTPDSEYHNELDNHRAQEARELLASVFDVDPEDFRPDIFDDRVSLGKKILKRHDLEQTVFRMLLDDHHFFHYFRSLIRRPTDSINNPFHKLAQRIDRVLSDLDAFAVDPSSSSSSSSPGSESPRDIPWAASHILGCVRRMRHEIYTRDRPLSAAEALSAARSLVHILDSVVSRHQDQGPGASMRRDRNLYLRLIGDRDQDFILGVLNLIPEAASQFLHNLEAILDRIEVYGAPAGYVERYRAMLGRLRASSTGSGLKRPVQGQTGGRRTKRMK